jgi:hypothetical protein
MKEDSLAVQFTLVMPVMRKPMLGQVLEHYCELAPGLIGAIVLVDYDEQFSEGLGLYEPLGRTPHRRVVVSGERYFNKSLALNLGVALSGARHVLVCDADVIVEPAALDSWARSLAARERAGLALTPVHMVETATRLPRDAPGIVAFNVEDFLRVQGYSSDFLGWGFEDRDFLWRLDQAGVRVLESGYATHISHDELERTRNYAEALGGDMEAALGDRLRMRQKNLRLYAARQRARVTSGTFDHDLARFGFTGLSAQAEARREGSRLELCSVSGAHAA